MKIQNSEIFQGKKNEAKEAGYRFYSNGKICKNGNIEIRNLRSECFCSTCFKEEQKRRKKWASENPEEYKKSKMKYRTEKKDRVRLSHNKYGVKRRIKFRNSKVLLSEFDRFVINEAYKLAKIQKENTGIIWHVDHMLPLNGKKVSGLHCADNIQVIPKKMNLEKNNKMWYTERYDFCH